MITPLVDARAQAMAAAIGILLVKKGIIDIKEYKALVVAIGNEMGLELQFGEETIDAQPAGERPEDYGRGHWCTPGCEDGCGEEEDLSPEDLEDLRASAIRLREKELKENR